MRRPWHHWGLLRHGEIKLYYYNPCVSDDRCTDRNYIFKPARCHCNNLYMTDEVWETRGNGGQLTLNGISGYIIVSKTNPLRKSETAVE